LNLLRNKRNISLDIAHPDGRAALLRVAAGCDVFVTNLRPGSVGRLRLRYPDIASIRPDVIYCQAHGFPSDSPQADAPAFDDIIQAACGVPDVLRRAGGRPGLMPTLLADKVSGLVLAYSIIAALFHRARTGEGQKVEVPMTDAMLAFLLVEHGNGAISRPARGPAGYQRILTRCAGRCGPRTAGSRCSRTGRSTGRRCARAAGHDDMVGDPGRQAALGRNRASATPRSAGCSPRRPPRNGWRSARTPGSAAAAPGLTSSSMRCPRTSIRTPDGTSDPAVTRFSATRLRCDGYPAGRAAYPRGAGEQA
jgi:crotonobetainyl-CoA:carnitine CoA-transferase CaiB-like acyl-CoA transferase